MLDDARAEADTVLERAHKQAEADAEQLRTAARRSGEREVAVLAATTREQAAEVERRAARMDERERLHTEEVERLAERERQLTAAQPRRSRPGRPRSPSGRRTLTEVGGAAPPGAGAGRRADRRRGPRSSWSRRSRRRPSGRRRCWSGTSRPTPATPPSSGPGNIVVDAIQRVASEQTAESVVSVLHLPGDEMKGRIIGREGRNIRAFESVTGVNLIIDDTPEAVLLSCFDPVRREVGRLTLEKLVLDGRIHPHRIEEVYDLARQEVERALPPGRRGRAGRGRHHRDPPGAGDPARAGCATAPRTGRTCSSTWSRPRTSPA